MSLPVILTITAMLLLNSLFAAYELALASVRADRLKYLIDQHRRGARFALYMKNRMDARLAVVQLGITLVGAIAAAVGGASAGENFSPFIQNFFGLESERAAKFIALSLFVLPLSAVTIIIGELIPKVLAIKNNEWVVTTL